MNYAQYLQDGGKADQFTEEQVQVIKAMQPYGEAFKQSPGGAIEMAANELHFDIQSPTDVSDFLAGLLSYADLVGDGSLKNDIQKFVNGDGQKLIQEAPVFRKCGGKVRAKVRKACGGKKLEKGAKVPVEKKGGCPCQYRRVGGRIQLVDCNGIPVAKNGAVLKFQQPSSPIEFEYDDPNATSKYFGGARGLKYTRQSDGRWKSGSNYASAEIADWLNNKYKQEQVLNKDYVTYRLNENKVPVYRLNGADYMYLNGSWSRVGGGQVYVKDMDPLRQAYRWYKETNGSPWKKNQDGTFSRIDSDKIYNAISGDNGQVIMKERLESPAMTVEPDNTSLDVAQNYQGNTGRQSGTGKSAGQIMFETQLPGALSDYSLNGRRGWMRSAENAEAIKNLGFTADNYTGTREQNRALLAAMKAQAAAQAQQAQPVVQTPLTNQQLLDYDPNAQGAQSLSAEDQARRQRLLAAKQANTARQRTALTLRGKEYADERSYNQAVQDYNQELTNKAWQDAIASGYSGKDILKANRYQQTGNRLLDDARLQTILRRKDINEDERQTALNAYLKNNYKGADYLRASQIMSNYTPATLETNYVKPKEQAIDWNATTFAKNGGKFISYADYLK